MEHPQQRARAAVKGIIYDAGALIAADRPRPSDTDRFPRPGGKTPGQGVVY